MRNSGTSMTSSSGGGEDFSERVPAALEADQAFHVVTNREDAQVLLAARVIAVHPYRSRAEAEAEGGRGKGARARRGRRFRAGRPRRWHCGDPRHRHQVHRRLGPGHHP